MKKKLVAMLMVFVMVFSTSVVLFATSNDQGTNVYVIEYIDFYDLEIVDVFCEYTGLNMEIVNNPELLEQFLYDRELMRLQEPAIEAYNLLMEALISNRSGTIDFSYRDDYAGAFIDDNHNLVVQLTNMERGTIASYQALVNYSDIVVFTEVAFSFNELKEFGSIFMETLEDSNLQITSHGIDAMNNAYSISLYYADEESASFARSFEVASRSLSIPISISLGGHIELHALYGGAAIGTSARPNSFSVGATGFGPPGTAHVLATTGHFDGIAMNTPVIRNGVSIGTVVAFRSVHGGGGGAGAGGDWAIISLNGTGTGMMTNRTRMGDRLLSGQQNFGMLPIGARVGGTGMSTIVWSGTVARNFQSHLGATGLTFVTPTQSNRPRGGDSGGTIWASTGAQISFTGVHKGSLSCTVSGVMDYWIYSPAFIFRDWFRSIPAS